MLSSIGLRLAVRIIPQALSATGPAFSFVSHFQTRSFLSTSRLAQPTARTPSVNSQSDSTMKKPAAKKRVTAKKKPPAETKPPVEKRKVPLKSKKGISCALVHLYSHVEIVWFSDHPPYNPASSQGGSEPIYSILPGTPCKPTKIPRYENHDRPM